MSHYLAASLIVILTTLPFLGQVKESGVGVIADKMEIPRYGVPLAAMSGVSAEVTLRLQMKKNGDVISVNVVSTHADCGFASGCDTDVRKGWGASFVDAATQAALSFRDIPRDPLEREAATAVAQQRFPDTTENDDEANQKLRCLKCYSTDVTCRELDKPLTNAASLLSNPIAVHARICTCNSCGYEWDDEDNL
jgi:hypothetical protein